jgi:DNA-binding GntR family transcriptional regulator
MSGNELRLDYAIANVSAIAADEQAGSMLKVEVGGPLVRLTEIFYQNPSKPLCYSVNLFVPEEIRLDVVRWPANQRPDLRPNLRAGGLT